VDERVIRYCPPQDKPEMERIRRAVEHASNEAHGLLIILLEWTAMAEADCQWLRVLMAYQGRVEALERVAKREVAPLPQPWDNQRLVPVGWGRLVPAPERRTARDWHEFRVHRLLDVEEAVSLRWRDVLGYEAVFDDLETALGERLIHKATRERLAWFREHVLRLADQVAEWDAEFELPADSGEHGSVLREQIDWEAIRGVPKEKHAREWMPESQRVGLEEWEREQAEALRNPAPGSR
jgi:hypothetical protein